MNRSQEIEEFLKARNEALLSLDEVKIRAYAEKYGAQVSDDPEAFWRSVHKAITAIEGLPLDIRQKSKLWLEEHNSQSWDDGNL